MIPYKDLFPDCLPAGGEPHPDVVRGVLSASKGRLTLTLSALPSADWQRAAERAITRALGLAEVRWTIDNQDEGGRVVPSGVGVDVHIDPREKSHNVGEQKPLPVVPEQPPWAEEKPPIWETVAPPIPESNPVPPPLSTAEPPPKQKPEIWFGKPVKRAVSPMQKVSGTPGKVAVWGHIFKIEDIQERRGKIGNSWETLKSLTFHMTDNASAVTVRIQFPAAKFPKNLEKHLKTAKKSGTWVNVQGSMETIPFFDKEEWILNATAISPAPKESVQDDAPQKRVELHLHTQMSEKDAVVPVAAAIQQAAAWGHKAIAITDHGVVHSFPEAMKAAKGLDIKVIYGVEGYLPFRNDDKKNHHIILLAKNAVGLRHLYELVSLSHSEHFYRRPRVTREILEEYREGLLIGGACERGEVYMAIRDGKPDEEIREIARFYDYLEVQPLGNNAFLVRDKHVDDEETLRTINRKIIALGDELGLPVCATGDVHFLRPEDGIYRDVLLGQMKMKKEGEPITPLYYRTTAEMLAEFDYLDPETAKRIVIDVPNQIADLCEPIRPIQENECNPKIEGSEADLRALTYNRAHELYGDPLPAMIEERVAKEINAICDKSYDVIYIIAQKLVAQSLKSGYLVGSRGSVGSSIVAYFSGITEVNALPPHYRCPVCKASVFPTLEERGGAASGVDMPPRSCTCGAEMTRDGFDIPFYTFLGFEADKKPDIDLNFSGEYQARAHAHTIEIFGEKNVYRAGTISTLQEKNSIGYARAYAEHEHKILTHAETLWLASGIVGVRTTTGQHPGGLIVVPHGNEINEFTPVNYSANKKESGMLCTHFDYHAIEDNLLKLDILAHDGPTIIKHLEQYTGVDNSTIDIHDPKVMDLFTSTASLGFEGDEFIGKTGTLGVPEFGTNFVRGMLEKTRPSSVDELIRISGLSHGTDVWRGNAEDLVDAGTATLRDIICARDDITIFLVQKGIAGKTAFTISEAVRKGKGLTPAWEAEMKSVGVPGWYMQSMQKIKYMFPKAHAVAYVMLSLRIAWFKVYHPAAYYAAFFSCKADDFDYTLAMLLPGQIANRVRQIAESKKDKKVSKTEQDKADLLESVYEMKTRGIALMPLDVRTAPALGFVPSADGKGIIPPLLSVPGLGAKAAESIVEAREESPFLSGDDLLCRTKATKAHFESLKSCGALGDLPESMQMSLFG